MCYILNMASSTAFDLILDFCLLIGIKFHNGVYVSIRDLSLSYSSRCDIECEHDVTN